MRSDNVTKGAERAPNRSLFYALGYTPEDLEKPLIAVVSAHSDIVPGHMNLDKLTDAVKSGIEAAGGTPFMVPAIGVCDGIAMGHVGMKYSLASRELICDSVETMFMAHQFDGCVLVPNCDKIVPGMVMAAVRMNVPAVVCSGGPMLAGTYDGQENPLPTADAASIQEVQSYLTYWTGAYDCLFFCMNAELYNSLSPELQAIVDEAGQAACEYERELNRSQDQEIMDKWAEAGVEITELTPEAAAEFAEASAPVYDEFADELTPELIEAFTSVTQADAGTTEPAA